jgi:hypothetical protein
MKNKLRPTSTRSKNAAISQAGKGRGELPLVVLLNKDTGAICDTVSLDERMCSALKSACAALGITPAKFIELAILEKKLRKPGCLYGDKEISAFFGRLEALATFETKLNVVGNMIVARCDDLSNYADTAEELNKFAVVLLGMFDDMTKQLRTIHDDMGNLWHTAFKPALKEFLVIKEEVS